jgi:hypothetical protein
VANAGPESAPGDRGRAVLRDVAAGCGADAVTLPDRATVSAAEQVAVTLLCDRLPAAPVYFLCGCCGICRTSAAGPS